MELINSVPTQMHMWDRILVHCMKPKSKDSGRTIRAHKCAVIVVTLKLSLYPFFTHRRINIVSLLRLCNLGPFTSITWKNKDVVHSTAASVISDTPHGKRERNERQATSLIELGTPRCPKETWHTSSQLGTRWHRDKARLL